MYEYNNNTPYATIFLTQESFNKGTVRITVPENIYYMKMRFHPNPENDFQPTIDSIKVVNIQWV